MNEPGFEFFKSRDEFRDWLERNHDTSQGIWMIFYKRHTGEKCIQYKEALEEELCFGWIDSLVKKIDDNKYARKFMPRKDTKKWSQLNKRKVVELIKGGKMTRAGLDKIDTSVMSTLPDPEERKFEEAKNQGFSIPGFIIGEFAKNEPALANFSNLAPSYQRQYIAWITHGKKEATMMNRVQESIGLLKENRRLGLK